MGMKREGVYRADLEYMRKILWPLKFNLAYILYFNVLFAYGHIEQLRVCFVLCVCLCVYAAVQEERQRGKERGENEVESSSSYNEEMPVDKILDAELAVEPKTETYSDGSPGNSVRKPCCM